METTNEVKGEVANTEATIVDEKKFNFSPKELWNKHKGKVKTFGAFAAGGALAVVAGKGLAKLGADHNEGESGAPFEMADES